MSIAIDIARDTFTTNEVREANTIIKRARRNSAMHTVPEWAREASRQYTREWARAKRGRSDSISRPLYEDGIIDLIAIEIAVSGTRVVALTRLERLIAAEQMRAKGLAVTVVAERLGLNERTVDSFNRDLNDGAMKVIGDAIADGILQVSPAPVA